MKRKPSPAALAALKKHAFRPGPDNKRNTAGPISKERAAAIRILREGLATGGDMRALVAVIWREALRGKPWAVQMILDYTLGKPKENEGEPIPLKVAFVYGGGNGNAA